MQILSKTTAPHPTNPTIKQFSILSNASTRSTCSARLNNFRAFSVFSGSTLCVLCGCRYVAVDCAVHRRERRVVVRRRPEVADKPCRNFQTLGVTECQCPRIVVSFVFHPKCPKSLCHIRYCSTWRQLPAPWDTHLRESNAICPDATYVHLPFRQRTALLKPCQRNLRHMASFHSFHMAYANRLSVHEFKIRSAHMGYAVEYLIHKSPVWLQSLFFTTPPEETNPDFSLHRERSSFEVGGNYTISHGACVVFSM